MFSKPCLFQWKRHWAVYSLLIMVLQTYISFSYFLKWMSLITATVPKIVDAVHTSGYPCYFSRNLFSSTFGHSLLNKPTRIPYIVFKLRQIMDLCMCIYHINCCILFSLLIFFNMSLVSLTAVSMKHLFQFQGLFPE